jgi:hypothetical protein
MMESAGELLFFATSFALLSKSRLNSPRSDLSRPSISVPPTQNRKPRPPLKSVLRSHPIRLVRSAVRKQCPNDPGDLVRLRHYGDIPVLCLEQLHEPRWPHFLSCRHGARAVNDHGAQVRISTLTDTQQPHTAPCAALPRDNTKPRSKLPPRPKLPRVTNRSHDSGRCQRSNSRNGSEPSATLVTAFVDLELLL